MCLLGVGLVHGKTVLAVGVHLPQAIEVCHRDLAKLGELISAVHFVLPPEDGLGRRSRQPAVGVVHLGKQRLIRTAVLREEPVALVLREPHMARAPVLGDQAAELGLGVAGHLLQVSPEQTFLRPRP